MLFRSPACTRDVDVAKLGHFLTLGYDTGEDTLIRQVRRLPAASMLVLEKDRPVQQQAYWQLAPHFFNKRHFDSPSRAAVELRELLDDSVRLRMVSDVPLGAFLSGGIDSSAIVASMVEQVPQQQVKSFTMGFSEDSFDETGFAQRAAQHLGVSHHATQVTPSMETLQQCLEMASADPLADTSFIPTYFLAQFARQHVTVALSGDGGDECFAGYETYVADRLHRALSPLPAWLWQHAERAAEQIGRAHV